MPHKHLELDSAVVTAVFVDRHTIAPASDIPSTGHKFALKMRGPLAQGLFGCGALTAIAAILGTLIAITFAFNGNADALGLLCLCILSIGLGLSFIALAYILTYLRYLVNKASN